jgi:hypothetical protein
MDIDFSKYIKRAEKREVHPLASIRSNLNLTNAYCDLCKKKRAASFFKKLFAGDRGSYQTNAIKYAGKTIEAAKNYELNTPEWDVTLNAYYNLRPIISPLVGWLEKYANSGELKKGLENFVKRYKSEGGIEIKKEKSSVVMQTLSILINEKSEDNLGPFLLEKAFGGLLGSLEKVNKKELTNAFKYVGGNFKMPIEEREDDKIAHNMEKFIERCVGKDCACSWVFIGNSFRLVSGLEYRVKEAEKGLIKGGTWIFDFLASVLDNMKDSEFDELKKLGGVYLKSQNLF